MLTREEYVKAVFELQHLAASEAYLDDVAHALELAGQIREFEEAAIEEFHNEEALQCHAP